MPDSRKATISDRNFGQCDIGGIVEVEAKGGIWGALDKTATLSSRYSQVGHTLNDYRASIAIHIELPSIQYDVSV